MQDVVLSLLAILLPFLLVYWITNYSFQVTFFHTKIEFKYTTLVGKDQEYHFVHSTSDNLARPLLMVCCSREDPRHMPRKQHLGTASCKGPIINCWWFPRLSWPDMGALKQDTHSTCCTEEYVDIQASGMQKPHTNYVWKRQIAKWRRATGKAGQASGRATIYNFIQTVQNRKQYIAPPKRENSTYVICLVNHDLIFNCIIRYS